jgi:hypothetical protein
MQKLMPLIVCAGIAACSSQPRQDSPAAAPVAAAQPAPAPESQPAATVAAREEESAAATAGATKDEKFRAPAGYKVKSKGGGTVYCKSETPVGTRFATEYCFTEAQLERIEKNKRSIQEDHAQRTRTCAGASCSGGT